MKKLFSLTLAMILAITAFSQTKSKLLNAIIPDYSTAQFAGNIGFISLGVGYDFGKERIHLSLINGYVPKAVSPKPINMISLKGSIELARFKIDRFMVIPYAGIAGVLETSGLSYYKLPSRYPDGYYVLSALHATGFVGCSFKIPLSKTNKHSIEFYIEEGTVDTYAYFFLENSRTIRFTDILSTAVGVVYRFNK